MYVTNSLDVDHVVCPPGLTDRSSRRLPLRLAEGAHLFREGDEVACVYQIISGVVRLTRLLPNGRRQVIAFGFPGDVIGFPYKGNHHSDCEALTRAEVTPYRLACLEGGTCAPELRCSFLDATLHEIAAMQDHFMMLGRKSASERVASFLCVLAERIGASEGGNIVLRLSMSRADIADFLGLTTETVSRCITQLRTTGVISLRDAHTVVVENPDRLELLSEGD